MRWIDRLEFHFSSPQRLRPDLVCRFHPIPSGWFDPQGLDRRGRIACAQGFDRFEAWRDAAWEEEDLQRHKLDRKIKAEARWAVEGISARRKRNQGRVRALQGLRAERASQIRRQDTAAMALDAGEKSGKKVIETLDLLQEILGDYPGTVLLVSHDRDFIDRVATTTVALEGDGRAVVYAGGWSDYRAQRRADVPVDEAPKTKVAKGSVAVKAAEKSGLSFTEKHRLEALPAEIERLEAEIAKLSAFMADPDLFAKEPVKFKKATEALVERQAALAAAEEEWLELEDKAAG